MSQYLFLFTIGPVQSFIAQARKTQDLYAGSNLLTNLIGSTMKELKNKVNNYEFIFPNEEIKHKPNRFIAKIESDYVEKFGKELEEYTRKEFQQITTNVLGKLDLSAPNGFESQAKTHFQVNWIALPLKENDYPHKYKALESYLGAVKNVREFNQLNETGRKCSLCGERNALFYKKTLQNKKPAYIQEGAIELDKNELNSGEGLCAVCFSKRFYEKEDFPSTAGISAMDWLWKIPNNEKIVYKGLFNNFDEQLYYKDNLREEYLKKYGHFKDDKFLSQAELQLKKFYTNYGKPSKYYALIMLDGDNMGKWLSGEFLEDKDKSKLRDFHEALSKKLGKYTKDVISIIKEPKGKLVYAGGDDVMAVVNLGHLFGILTDLRTKFPNFKEIKDFDKFNFKKGSTASCGVVIAHYKTPLSEVLKWARKMEKEAKLIDDKKDAFAIAVLKRSGEIRKTVFKWKHGTSSIIEILENLIRSLKQEDFSNTFIKNLSIEFRRLMDKEGQYKDGDIIKTEMKRWIARSCMLDKGRKKQAIDDLTKKLNMLYRNRKSLDNFLAALDIADFIEREALNDNKN